MGKTLYEIIEWAKKNGEATTVSRLNMRLLTQIRAENINLHEVEPSTTCSKQLLTSIQSAAETILEKKFD